MKVLKCFVYVLILGFVSITICLFRVNIFGTTGILLELRRLAFGGSQVYATPYPSMTSQLSMNQLMDDESKLRKALRIDGPLDLTEIHLPNLDYLNSSTPSLQNTRYKTTCSSSIRNVPGQSEWFNERFNPRLKRFLDKEDVNNWERYSALVGSTLPLGFRYVNRRGLVRLVNNGNYSTAPIPMKKSPDQCVTCAVVGTSGLLKGANAGAEIDSFDFVFRMNVARLRGFEKDVGSKTHFYSGFPESIYVRELNNIQDVYFITPIFTHYMVYWLENFLNGSLISDPRESWRYHKDSWINPRRMRILHPSFLRHFQTRFLNGKGRYPTTGGIMLAYALQVCDQTKMFGFGVSNSSYLHYYDKDAWQNLFQMESYHDYTNEWQLWEKLEKENIVEFHHPTVGEQTGTKSHAL